MVAQIVTKQKAAPPPGMISLQNMEMMCPWLALPEEKFTWQPGLVTLACRHNPEPEAARRSLIVLPRGRGHLTGDR